MDARTEILSRINSSLRRTGTPNADGFVPAEHPMPEVASDAVSVTTEAHTDIVELFVDRLEDYDAGVHRVRESEAAATIAGLFLDADDVVAPHDLDETLIAEFDGAVLWDSVEDPQPVERLNTVGGVLTQSVVSIADTGTICLSGPGCGRRAITLVPDHHVCLVRKEDIVRIPPEAVRVLVERGLADRPQTWVSGPSATVDIELERVAGVHGPRTLDVVIVE